MVTYGYPVGDIINSTKLIIPHELNKIMLTPKRSKFIVVGTKDSIFEWMEYYGSIICELDKEPRHVYHSKSMPKHTSKHQFKISLINHHKMLNFDLYDEKEHDGIVKRLFAPGKSKMKLEIKVDYDNNLSTEHINHVNNTTPVMSAKCENGTRLQDALTVLKHSSKLKKYHNLSSEQLARVTCDYE
ncbi:hypothetical protein C1645_733746 [Glomus cerebriforme]|uniref:Uncharacterized protein n=1 Tax=Glomus cerebriforme TaxID=658196 RepID=A0A397TC76_9GLOM|nr:hypothetical protein C1645_733746 [Glomus cerebriforme]